MQNEMEEDEELTFLRLQALKSRKRPGQWQKNKLHGKLLKVVDKDEPLQRSEVSYDFSKV